MTGTGRRSMPRPRPDWFTSSLANLSDSRRVRVNCVVPDWIGLPRAHTELEFLHLFQLVLLVRR